MRVVTSLQEHVTPVGQEGADCRRLREYAARSYAAMASVLRPRRASRCAQSARPHCAHYRRQLTPTGGLGPICRCVGDCRLTSRWLRTGRTNRSHHPRIRPGRPRHAWHQAERQLRDRRVGSCYRETVHTKGPTARLGSRGPAAPLHSVHAGRYEGQAAPTVPGVASRCTGVRRRRCAVVSAFPALRCFWFSAYTERLDRDGASAGSRRDIPASASLPAAEPTPHRTADHDDDADDT